MEENTAETPTITLGFNKRGFIYGGCILLLAICFGGIHYVYVTTLFENDRNFSHLSDLEREMSFRTEMGFYYSFYKTIVQTKPFILGIHKLVRDRLVEYPKEINAFSRFSVHPEVLIGAMYSYFDTVVNTTNYRQCYMVERGAGHPPVQSCIGVGVPIMFYLEVVWVLAGVTVASLFLLATVLSDSIFGGIMAVLQYFANHAESTRVQWAPNERENFALPFILLQSWLQTLQLRRGKTAIHLQLPIFLLNIVCLLVWQFTPFIFLTQFAIFFVMEQLRIIKMNELSVFAHNHFCSLQSAAIFFHGNDMLQSSLQNSYFFIIVMYTLVAKYTRIKVLDRATFWMESFLILLRVCLTTCAAFYLRHLLGENGELHDAHVWDILYSKFTTFKSFHTLIYTCSDVFDFLPLSTVVNMTKTLLIPFVLVIYVGVVNQWARDAYARCKSEMENASERDASREDEDSGIDTEVSNRQGIKRADKTDMLMVYVRNLKIEPAVFYNVSQMAVFGVMAVLVMRLKLLFSTQMCIVSSLIVKKHYHNILPKFISKYINGLWLYALIIIPILKELTLNVKQEMSHIGEFSDYPQEELLQWIAKERKVAAFAGSMPVLATVLLTTRQPVVAHPHYEHEEARERAYAVYKMYGKFTPQHFYQEMTQLKASHLIVEEKYCYGKSGRGCTFEYIWDIEVPELKSNQKLCHLLLTGPVEHFYQVFRNGHYAVFRIHDFGVRYMPRSFDT